MKRVKEYSGVLSAGLAVVMTTQVEGSGGRITSWCCLAQSFVSGIVPRGPWMPGVRVFLERETVRSPLPSSQCGLTRLLSHALLAGGKMRECLTKECHGRDLCLGGPCLCSLCH